MSCFSTVIWCNLGQILTKGANELWVKCFDKTEVDANPFAGQWPGLQPLIVSSGQAENSVLIKVKLIRLNQTFSRSTWFLCKNSCFSSTHLESWKRVQTNGDFSCHSLHLCSQSEGFQKVQTDRAAKMKMTWHVKAKMLLWTPRLYITDHTVCKTREAINPWGGISFQFSTWTFQDWSSTVHPFIFTPPPPPPTCLPVLSGSVPSPSPRFWLYTWKDPPEAAHEPETQIHLKCDSHSCTNESTFLVWDIE